MAEDADDHTIRLLKEMRGEMREMRSEMRAGFDAVDHRFDETNLRMDGMAHMMMLLAGNVAGHEERIEALEEAASQGAKD